MNWGKKFACYEVSNSVLFCNLQFLLLPLVQIFTSLFSTRCPWHFNCIRNYAYHLYKTTGKIVHL